MKNLGKPLTLILAAAFFLCGCAADRSRESKKIIEKDNGRVVELVIGNTLIVELTGNPSTGYSWDVASVDASVLKEIEGAEKFKPDADRIGSPGKVSLRFKAVGAGKTALKLVYHRPWEKNIPPIRAYQVTVKVRK